MTSLETQRARSSSFGCLLHSLAHFIDMFLFWLVWHRFVLLCLVLSGFVLLCFASFCFTLSCAVLFYSFRFLLPCIIFWQLFCYVVLFIACTYYGLSFGSQRYEETREEVRGQKRGGRYRNAIRGRMGGLDKQRGERRKKEVGRCAEERDWERGETKTRTDWPRDRQTDRPRKGGILKKGRREEGGNRRTDTGRIWDRFSKLLDSSLILNLVSV